MKLNYFYKILISHFVFKKANKNLKKKKKKKRKL